MSTNASVIIRLQNLSWEARSTDIRQFFSGLTIPDGGVHIIGGPKGDAFIAFQSDEDARQAMMRDGYHLCNKRIKLMLSSKNEMYSVIAQARGVEMSKKISSDNNNNQSASTSSTSAAVTQATAAQDMSSGSSNLDDPLKKENNNATSAASVSVFERMRQNFPSTTSSNTDGTALSVAKQILSSLSALGTNVTAVSSASVLAHLQQLISQSSSPTSKTSQLSQPAANTSSSALSPPLTSIPGLDLSSLLKTAHQQTTSSTTAAMSSPISSSLTSGSCLKPKQSAISTVTSTTIATSTISSTTANINQAQLAKLIAAANQVTAAATSDAAAVARFNLQPTLDNVHNNAPAQQGSSFAPSTFPFPVFGGMPFPFPMPGVPTGPPFPSAMPFGPMVRPQQPDIATALQSNYEIQSNVPTVSPQVAQHHPSHQLSSSALPQQNMIVIPPNPFASAQQVPSVGAAAYYSPQSTVSLQAELQTSRGSNVEVPLTEPYLRLSGLHKFEAYKQIKQICSAIKKFRLEYVKVINDENGERTGQAFVMFVTIEDAKLALKTAKEKGFTAEPCKEFDYAHAVDSFMPSALRRRKCEGFYAIRVVGFPSKWDRRDLKKFFQGVDFSSRERITILEPDSRHSQMCAFLILSSQTDVEKALFYDGEEIGKNKISVTSATKEEVERENSVVIRRGEKKAGARNPTKKSDGTSSPREHLPRKPRECEELPATIVCLRMIGLPHNCTEKDVREFFGRIAIAPKDGIQFIVDKATEHFTGEAYIKFVDNTECKKAFAKNREVFLGTKVIDLKPLSLWDYQNASSVNNNNNLRKENVQKKATTTPDVDNESNQDNYRMSNVESQDDAEVPATRLAAAPSLSKTSSASGDMPRELIPGLSSWVTANREFQQAQMPPPEIFNDVMPSERISSVPADVEAKERNKWPGNNEQYYGYYPERFGRDDRYNMLPESYVDPHDMESGHRFRMYPNNGRPGVLQDNTLEFQGPLKRPLLPDPILSSPQDMTTQMSNNNFHKRYCVATHMMMAHKQRYQNLPPIPPELEHLKGQILLLSNVAYRSTKEDICGWLSEFHPIDDTLKIRHDDNGKPTGHAIVAMETFEDAQRACSIMSGSRFLNRVVHITLM